MFYDNRGPDGFVFIIGNKVDLEIREVSREEGCKKAESLHAPYCQISAKTGKNVNEAFIELVEHFEKRVNDTFKDTNNQFETQIAHE